MRLLPPRLLPEVMTFTKLNCSLQACTVKVQPLYRWGQGWDDPDCPLCLMPHGAALGTAGASTVKAEPQPGREVGADNPLEFSSQFRSSVGEGDRTRCPCA